MARKNMDMGTEPAAEADSTDDVEPFEPETVTLTPHPRELTSAIEGDHVVVFMWTQGGSAYQFELSGDVDEDDIDGDLDLDWRTIEMVGDVAAPLVNDIGVHSIDAEDQDGREFTIEVRAGARHPKGTPIHTEAAQDGDTDE